MLEQLLSPTQNTAATGLLGAQSSSQAASVAGERQSLPKAGVFSGLIASLLKREETPGAAVAKGVPAVPAAPAALLASTQGAQLALPESALPMTDAMPAGYVPAGFMPAGAVNGKPLNDAIGMVLNPALSAKFETETKPLQGDMNTLVQAPAPSAVSAEVQAAEALTTVLPRELAHLPEQSIALTAAVAAPGLLEKSEAHFEMHFETRFEEHVSEPGVSDLSPMVETFATQQAVPGSGAAQSTPSSAVTPVSVEVEEAVTVAVTLPIQARGVANGLANGLPQAALENRQAGSHVAVTLPAAAAKGAPASSVAANERLAPQALEIKASSGGEKVEEPGADLLKSPAFAQNPASLARSTLSKPAAAAGSAETTTSPTTDKAPALVVTPLVNPASAVAEGVGAEVTSADVQVADVIDVEVTNVEVTGTAVSDEALSNSVLVDGEPLKAQVITPADAKTAADVQQTLERAEFVNKPGAVLTQAETGHARQVEMPQAAASRASSAFEATPSAQAGNPSQAGAQSGQGSHGQSAGQQSQGQAAQQQFMQMAQTVAQDVQANRQQNSFNQQLAQKLETAQGVQSDSPLLEESLSALTTPERRGQLPQGLQSIGLPVAHPRWGQALGQRVVYMANNQVQQAQITLNPDKLGPVQIKLQLDKEQQVHVTMTAQHGVTREAMEAAMPRLKELMEQAGVELGSVNVNQEQREFAQQNEQAGSGGGTRGGAKGLNVEGEVADTPATQVYATDNLVDYYA